MKQKRIHSAAIIAALMLVFVWAGGALAALPAENVTVTCTESVVTGQEITCTATATATEGETIAYTWSTDKGAILTGQGTDTVTVSSPMTGIATVTAQVVATPPYFPPDVISGDTNEIVSTGNSLGTVTSDTLYITCSLNGYKVYLNQYLSKIRYGAVNTNPFRFVLMTMSGDYTTVHWVSPLITPNQQGVNEWSPDTPVPIPAQSSFIGIYVPGGQAVPVGYTTYANRGFTLSNPSLQLGVLQGPGTVTDTIIRVRAYLYTGSYPAAPTTVTKTASVAVSSPPPPTVSITGPETAVEGETKHYTATHDAVVPVTISWSANGNTYTGAEVDIPFTSAGSKTVTVTVTPDGYPESVGTSSLTVAVSQYPSPTISITGPETAVEGETKQYTVTHDAIVPVTIAWDVNGTAYSGSPANIVFPAPGAYTVTATVYPTDYPASVATTSMNVTVGDRVTISCTESVQEGQSIACTASGTPGAGETWIYLWTTNNGAVSSGQGTATAAILPSAPGAATITLALTVDPGQIEVTKTAGVTVTQYPAPTVSITGSAAAVEGETKHYTVTHDAVVPVTITWSAEGNTYTGAEVDIPFATPGSKTVAVTVTPNDYPASAGTSSLSVTVTQYPAPTVSLTGPISAFKGETKQFTVSHDNQTDTMTIEWTMDGSAISGATGSTIEVPFSALGDHTVAVKVYPTAHPNSSGTGSVQVAVSAPDPPTVSITGPATAVEGETKTYAVTHDAVVPVTITWDVNGTSYSGAEINVPFVSPGSYNVTATVTPNDTPESAATSSLSVTVTQYPSPTVSITGSESAVEGETKHYAVTHDAVIPVTIAWSADGNTYTGTEVDIPFATPGSKTVSVTVTPNDYPASAATSSLTVTVTQYPAPTIALNGPETANEGETKHYTVTHDAIEDVTIEWKVDGSSVPGTEIDVSFPSGAANRTITVTVYPVSHPNSKATASKTVIVTPYPSPVVTLDGPTTAYEGDTKHYAVTHDAVVPVTITWDVNGASYSGSEIDVPFAASGSYNVTATVTPNDYPNSAGTAAKSVTVSKYPTPVISLAGPDTAIEGETKAYAVTHDAVVPVTITWDVNGTAYEGATIEVPFPATGSYNVAVTVYPTAYPDSSATSTKSVTVTTYPVPTVSITGPESAVEGETKHYAVTHDAVGEVTITWSADGNTYTGAEVDIPFATPGNKTISVTVTPDGHPDAAGTSSMAVAVSQYPAPVASLEGPSTAIVGDTKQYTVTTSEEDPVTIEWDVEGTAYQGNPVEVPFSTLGNYTVTATVYFNAYPNSKRVLNQGVLVTNYPAPTVDLSGPSTAIEGDTKQFTITHDEANPVTVEWKLDGTVVAGTETGADIQFATEGIHEVSVKVYPTAHPESSSNKAKTVAVERRPPPTISVSGPASSMPGNTERYTVTHDASVPVTIEWDVNGTAYSGQEIDVTFAESGSYKVNVKVYPTAYPDSFATKTKSVTVIGVRAPAVSVSCARSATVGVPMNLSAAAVTRTAGIAVVYKWDLPDGSQVESLKTTYTPRTEDVGTMVIRFSAHPEGHPELERIKEISVVVFGEGVPPFTLKKYHPQEGMAPYRVNYSATANLYGYKEPLTYSWNMGDGTTLTGKAKVMHTYTVPGNYTVELTISDTKGNQSVLTDTVSVIPIPPILFEEFLIRGSNKYMKAPINVSIRPIITGGNTKVDRFVSYAWTVNGEPVGRNSRNLLHKFENTGTYEVAMTVTTKNGVTSTGSTTVTVNPNQPPTCEITYEDQPRYKRTKLNAVCTDPDGRVRSYLWDLGDGLSMAARTIYAKYATSGTYPVTLTATDDSGAQVTVSQDVVVERN